MTKVILSFSELTAEQQLLAGGKGGALARLYQAGYPVPDGFVILPSAFVGDELSAEAWDQVQARLERMTGSDTAYAVRSSALVEDSGRASFAGEFETVLDARTTEEVRQAIHTVRRSRRSERVRAYSLAQGIKAPSSDGHDEHGGFAMAVVVQRLVPAAISGVLFTADPVSGSREFMVGNYASGLGDKLVSGEVQPNTFTLERPAGRYHGPPDLRPFARKLYKLAARLEKELGSAQDIEWAVASAPARRHRLNLLQSRPITSLIGHDPATGEWNESLTGDYLWSSVNYGEAMPGVMTPFTWSMMQRGALANWIEVEGIRSFGNVAGRMYTNISVFASLFRALGRDHRQVLAMIEGTLHTSLPTGMEIPVLPTSKRAVTTILPMLVRIQWKQWQDLRGLPELLAANPAWCQEIHRRIDGAETGGELVSLWHDAIILHLPEVWSGVLSSANHSVVYTNSLRKDLAELVGTDDADLLISGLSDGAELLPSLGPVIGVSKVDRGEMTRQAFLEQYGHRGEEEFEVSKPRLGEDATWLDRQLAESAQMSDAVSSTASWVHPVDVETLLAERRAAVEDAWQRLRSNHPRKARALRRRIEESAERCLLREAARSELARMTWIVRAWALRAGELAGLEDQVFFLTIEEVLDLLTGDEQALRFIPARRETYEKYCALPAYPAVIRGRFDPFRWAADPERRTDLFDAHAPHRAPAPGVDGSDTIIGAVGSAGRVEGLVRRLDSPDEGEQLQPGEILVTAMTNIGWTLLFPRAAAIVTDVGAPLSHAAIVARELGIPAVVGCGDATVRLRTGDRVLVDGGRGIVKVLR